MNNLFEINKQKHLTINELLEMEFEDFKNSGKLLNLDNIEEIESYHSKIYSESLPIYFRCIPLLNTIENTKKVKYLLIELNDDIIFLQYKIVQYINVKIIKCYGLPISKNSNKSNVNYLIELLSKKPFIRFLYPKQFKEEFELLPSVNSTENNDYYYSRENFEQICTSKFKYKKLINRYEKNEDFQIVATHNIYGDYQLLRKEWEENIGKKLHSINLYNNCCKQVYSDLIFLNIRYQNRLISQFVFIKYMGILFNICRMNLGRIKQTDTYLNSSLNYIDDVMNYFTFKMFPDINYVYFFGSSGNDKNLLEYKKKHSTGCIEYLQTKTTKEDV